MEETVGIAAEGKNTQQTEQTGSKDPENVVADTTIQDADRGTRKLKTVSDELGKDDWEAVEKPSEVSSEKGNTLSEEGEKVEKPDLAESEGEVIEKPNESLDAAGAVNGGEQVQNNLAKDW